MPALPSYNNYLASLLSPGDYYPADQIGQFCSVVRKHGGDKQEEAASKLDVSVTKLSRTEGGDLRYIRVAQKAFRFYTSLRLIGPFCRVGQLGTFAQRDEGREGKGRLEITSEVIDAFDVAPITKADLAVVRALQTVEYIPPSTLPPLARLAIFSVGATQCYREGRQGSNSQELLNEKLSKALERAEHLSDISSPEVLMEALHGSGSFDTPCRTVARTLAGVQFRGDLFYRLEDSPQAHSFITRLKETNE